MDRGGRMIGIAVFALGIVVLLFVFWMAFSMFTSPASTLFPGSSGGATAVGLGNAIALIIVRVILLFVMTLAGSSIASRGIALYLGSRRANTEDKE